MAKPKILVLFYSMYGHIFEMCKAAAEGVEQAGGEVIFKRVEELVPSKYLDDAAKKNQENMKDIPVADPRNDLKDVDGLVLGIPTRFGNMSSQMANFWDQTGADWANGTLVGKPVGFITGSNTQHGGQESTILSSIHTLLHHGCLIVGLPYTVKEQSSMENIMGGSPYGVSTIAGPDGNRMPLDIEKSMAKELSARVTKIAAKLKDEKIEHE